MKKKLFSSVLAVMLVAVCAFALTACGDSTEKGKEEPINGIRYNLVHNLTHCMVGVSGTDGFGGSSNNVTYINEGTDLLVTINPEIGYYSNNIAIFVNGEERPFNDVNPDGMPERQSVCEKAVGGTYYTDYHVVIPNPTDNIKVEIKGKYERSEGYFSFDKANGFDAAAESDTYIRFTENNCDLPTEEMTLQQFATSPSYTTTNRSIRGGEKLVFDVYRKSYDKNPDCITFESAEESILNSEFYHENGEYGYHYTYQYNYAGQQTLLIGNSQGIYCAVNNAENSTTGLPYATKDNKIKIEINADSRQLTITLYNYDTMSETVKKGLQLRVNTGWGKDNVVPVDFVNGGTAGEDGSRIFAITLADPYVYNTDCAYSYYIDLNHYAFPEWFTNTDDINMN